jgi:hypothetical protein
VELYTTRGSIDEEPEFQLPHKQTLGVPFIAAQQNQTRQVATGRIH